MPDKEHTLILVAAYTLGKEQVFLTMHDLFIVSDVDDLHPRVNEFKEKLLSEGADIKNMLMINVSGLLEKQGYEIRLRD